MKLAILLSLAVMTGVGQTPPMSSKVPPDEKIEMFRISLSIALRVCAQHPHATIYIFDDDWKAIPCLRIIRVSKSKAVTVPDWIDEMHAETKRRDAAIAEAIKLIKHNQEILSKR